MNTPSGSSQLAINARRLFAWSSTPAGIGVIFASGVIVRLLLLGRGGFPSDISTFQAWADKLATEGLNGFYRIPDYFVDYPPGYLYVLWMLGKIAHVVSNGAPSISMVKLPGVIADVGLAWLAMKLVLSVNSQSKHPGQWQGAVAAAIMLNPAVIFVSAVWGQVDSVYAVVTLGAIYLLATGERSLRRDAGGVALLALAIAIKPQGLFVVPVVAVVVFWRYAVKRTDEGLAPSGEGLLKATGLALLGAAVLFALALPFGESPAGLIKLYRKAAATYPYTSLWAFNFWGFIGFWRADLSGNNVLRLFGAPALYFGLAAFVVAAAGVMYKAVRRLIQSERELIVLLFGSVAITSAAFALLTRMHERYLFFAVACVAPLIAYKTMRRAFYALSALYLANIYFPYVYYVELSKSTTFKTFKIAPLFNLLYGTTTDSVGKKLLSLATLALCLTLAWKGWESLRGETPQLAQDGDSQTLSAPAEPSTPATPAAPAAKQPAPRSTEPEGTFLQRGVASVKSFQLVLHPINRKGLALAAILLAAGLLRLIGLGTPPGMYFDEIYHARAGGEYINGKYVFEYTHPPLGKEIIAVFMKFFSGFAVQGRGPRPAGMRDAVVASDGVRVAWAEHKETSGTLYAGDFSKDCGISRQGRPVALDFAPRAIAVTGQPATADASAPFSAGVVVAGIGPGGPSIARFDTGQKLWQSALPGPPSKIATLDMVSFVITQDGSLLHVTPEGKVTPIEKGAADLTSMGTSATWVSFPEQKKVVAFGADGKLQSSIQTLAPAKRIVGIQDANRILAATDATPGIEAIDTQDKKSSDHLDGASPQVLGTVPETGLAWVIRGATARVIEPNGVTHIGTVKLPQAPIAVIGNRDGATLVAITRTGIVCVGGHNAFAWRLAGAIFGALAVALVGLIALRLFGSLAIAALAGVFFALDGLAYSMSRIATLDTYVTTWILLSWLAVLSALFHLGGKQSGSIESPRPNRRAAIAWIAISGLAAGLSIATKWVGVYGLVGIIVLVAWDFFARDSRGIRGLVRKPKLSVLLLTGVFVVLPIGVYILSHIPYFQLGNSLGDLIEQQKGMYRYHAGLKADHPYGSAFWAWPFGRKAVWLYVSTHGAKTAAIYTIANPVVFLGGLVALVVMTAAAWTRRSIALAIAPLSAAVQFLPWVPVKRVAFLYHYLPVVPALCLALAWWLIRRRDEDPGRRRFEIPIVVLAAVVMFAVALPLLDGWYLAPGYGNTIRGWLFWLF